MMRMMTMVSLSWAAKRCSRVLGGLPWQLVLAHLGQHTGGGLIGEPPFQIAGKLPRDLLGRPIMPRQYKTLLFIIGPPEIKIAPAPITALFYRPPPLP